MLALCCVLVGLSASGAQAAPVYPNLVADPPGAAAAPVVYDDGAGPRLLMRFDGFVHNAGPGALEIFATGRSGTTMTNVQQRVYDSVSGSSLWANNPRPQVLFETDDSHNHWHLKNIARYSLWNSARHRGGGTRPEGGLLPGRLARDARRSGPARLGLHRGRQRLLRAGQTPQPPA